MRFLFLLPLLLLFALVAGCGGDSSAPSATPAPEATTATPAAAPTAEANGAAPGPMPQVKLQRVFPQLTFEDLTGLYQMPESLDAWLALERPGRVRLIDPSGGEAGSFLDITGEVNDQGQEEGLLGLAFAPDFVNSGVFYVYYTAANPRRSVLSRFHSAGNAADPGSEQVLLEVMQPFANHNGGQIVFGPEGYLYVGLGDGGSARDPMGNGQNLGVLLGKLLRLDVSGTGGYKVPPDNPFVGQQGARGEVWAYGLRNPWRFSFDAQTNDLWLADVGQDTREEIDIVSKGGNYGWSVMEGSQCLGGGNNCNRSGKIMPIFDYANSGRNCSITGGFVYRGRAIPPLQGVYIYSDYCSGTIWGLRRTDGGPPEQAQIAQADFPVSSFAQANDGELYVLDFGQDGGIYKVVP